MLDLIKVAHMSGGSVGRGGKPLPKLVVVVMLSLLLVSLLPATMASAQGSGPGAVATPDSPATIAGAPALPAAAGGNPLLGVVPARGRSMAGLALRAGSSNLAYHNGPVMRVNKTYAIYWVPSGFSVSPNYYSLNSGFLQNVAAASGASSNVYYSDTQYYDTTGNIAYNSTLGGQILDTNPYPASGCSDQYTRVCLTDAQLQAEIKRVIGAQGWTAGPNTMFFMYTPQNVGSCSGSSCAFSYFCAYHSWIGSGSSVILYANQPYAAWVPSACDAGQHPNGDDADATINVVSHEHNEAITDPQGTGWYDRRGYENGDKCAWNFGTALGGSSGSQYNQVINGGKYYLQQEWSNKTSRCVLTGF
jgi:hypothetical protein